MKNQQPQVSAELFTIPLEKGNYIVYAPLRKAAFVTNATVVNFLADLKEGVYDESIDKDGQLIEFLQSIEIVNAGNEELPITTFSGEPEPNPKIEQTG